MGRRRSRPAEVAADPRWRGCTAYGQSRQGSCVTCGTVPSLGGGLVRAVFSPRRWLVVLEELPPHMRPKELPHEDRVNDARGAIDDVERRRESLFGFAGGM